MLNKKHGIFAAALLLSALAGCSGGSSTSPTPTPAEPPASAPPITRTSETLPTEAARYAQVVELNLQRLNLPADLTEAQVSVTTGQASGLTVKNGFIRFLTGTDTGAASDITLKVSAGSKDILIPVAIPSERPTAVFAEGGSDEDGNASAAPPALSIKGLGVGNAIQSGEITISAKDAPKLDASMSKFSAYSSSANVRVNLAKHWTYDPATNSLKLTAQAMQTVLSLLPPGELALSINLVNEDASFAHIYTLNAYKPDATVSGRVVDTAGKVLTTLAGRKIAIRGSDNQTRLVVDVRADGTFQVDGLAAGTYQVVLLDVDAPEMWVAPLPVYDGSKSINMEFVAGPAASTAKAMSGASSARAGVRQSTVTQDGTPPPQRSDTTGATSRIQALAGASEIDCTPAQLGNGGISVLVRSGGKDVPAECPIELTIPQGTANVDFRVEASTTEYPNFTKNKSRYNDQWSYRVDGLPGADTSLTMGGGSVNETHYDRGVTVQHECLATGNATKAGPIAITGKLRAVNVGDSMMPTSVKLSIGLSCTPELNVTSANIATVNKAAKPVSVPIKKRDEGAFLSIPVKKVQPDYGVSMTVRYSPLNAVLTQARVGFFYGGTLVFADADVLPQAKQSPGTLVFNDLVIPPFPSVQKFGGKMNLVVELKGTINGVEVTSDAKLDNPVTVAGKAEVFTPLFRASDYITSPSRRYGQGYVDVGGDDWASNATIDWLFTNSYPFNDISSQHITQRTDGGSPLGHSSHFNGRTLDLRYADGAGGFSGPRNGDKHGAKIKEMLDAAAQEVASNAASKPNLAATLRWVNDNRAVLLKESANASEIWIGNAFIQLALEFGKFPDGKPIPGLQAWKDVSNFTLKSNGDHLHHWHLDRALNPTVQR